MTWHDELAEVLGKLSDLMERGPMRMSVDWKYDVSLKTDAYGFSHQRYTGWQTVTIRYFVDESLEDYAPLTIEGRTA